jgi:hypothetical protein
MKLGLHEIFRENKIAVKNKNNLILRSSVIFLTELKMNLSYKSFFFFY